EYEPVADVNTVQVNAASLVMLPADDHSDEKSCATCPPESQETCRSDSIIADSLSHSGDRSRVTASTVSQLTTRSRSTVPVISHALEYSAVTLPSTSNPTARS